MPRVPRPPTRRADLGKLEQGVVGLGCFRLVHARGLALDDEQPVAGQKDHVEFVLHAALIAYDEIGRLVAQRQVAAEVVHRLEHVPLQPATLDEIAVCVTLENQGVALYGKGASALELSQ